MTAHFCSKLSNGVMDNELNALTGELSFQSNMIQAKLSFIEYIFMA